MRSRLARLALATALAALLAGGCSYGKARNDNVSVGDGLAVESPESDNPTTTSTAAALDPAAQEPGAATPAPPSTPKREGATNQGIKSHPSGWKLTLTVNGQLTYKRSEDILMEVVARNAGSQPLQYDPNDLRHFAIVPAGGAKGRTWYDTDCRPAPAKVTGGAITLEPGEEAVFKTTYPGPGVDGSNDPCRLDPGDYDVGGLIAWCPPGTVQSDGTCDASKRDVIASGAVRIKIVP